MSIGTIPQGYAATVGLCAVALFVHQGASSGRPPFLDHAKIEQKGEIVLVLANSPRPLCQAIEAIRQEYGWIVDYEDPPYGPTDLVDDTDPGWREQHPDAKGVTRVAGGAFRSEFSPDTAATPSGLDPEKVLGKVLADYEVSGNPGEFILTREDGDRYAVVGIGAKDSAGNEKKVTPILDTRIAFPLQERTVGNAVQLIVRMLSEKSGYKVSLGSAPMNLILQTNVKLGGEEQPARALLAQLAMATRFPLVWRLLYDADARTYFMNLDIATEVANDPSGQIRLRPMTRH